MTLNQSPAPSPGESTGHDSGPGPEAAPAASDPAPVAATPDPTPLPPPLPAPAPVPDAPTASKPPGQSDNQFIFICMGVTFFIVLIGISIGGVRHFFPGLFANRTDAEIAAEVEAREAAARGAQPSTTTPAPASVPRTVSTANPPAQPPPDSPFAPSVDVQSALALLDSNDAAKRAEGLKALQGAGAAGVTALVSRLRKEQATTATAAARIKELERALQSALAQTSVERERREEAEVRSDEKRAADLYQQATTAVEAKNFPKARVLAEAVIRLSPDHVGARALRARCALEAGDGREAFDDYLVAIRLDPRFAPHHRGLGRALTAMGRPKEALAAFERALAIDPGDLEAMQLRDAVTSQMKLPEGK